MPDIPLRRNSSGNLFDSASAPHPGLFLSKGLQAWNTDKTQRGILFEKHVKKAAGFPASDIYEAAYRRWHRLVSALPTSVSWPGKLEGRLFIGMGGASVLETTINLSMTYGAPLIPASAQKGVARAYAEAVGIGAPDMDVLFGKAGPSPNDFSAGFVIFNDAWWIPGSAPSPLTNEVITVHHQEYYRSAGVVDATDFDSPIPNVQIAARGSFLFSLQCGSPEWAALARDLLSQALQKWGIGGKTAAGYGRFVPETSSITFSDQESIWESAQITYASNTRSIKVTCDGKTAALTGITKETMEMYWPGLLKQIERKKIFVQAKVKQLGNRIDLISVGQVNIEDVKAKM